MYSIHVFYGIQSTRRGLSGRTKIIETQPANPRRSLFENCFKSCFDTARWWGMSCAFDFLRNYWFRCFLRRVMVIFRQQKNFGPNVIYFVVGTSVGTTPGPPPARDTFWSDFWPVRRFYARLPPVGGKRSGLQHADPAGRVGGFLIKIKINILIIFN